MIPGAFVLVAWVVCAPFAAVLLGRVIWFRDHDGGLNDGTVR